MNKKLVLTGKAVLSTVMASTMACSMLSTNIFAQEPEVVPEEETTVEKVPVEEEITTTEEVPEVIEETSEEATEIIEEPVEAPEVVTVPSDTVTPNEIVDTPTTYNLPPDDFGFNSLTEEQLRSKIQELLDKAANLFEENKYRPMTEDDYYSKKASAEAALADPTLSHEKLAWQAYYMANCINAMKTEHELSESAKQIVIINKEVAKLNSSEYQLDAWEVLTEALSTAISRINGDPDKDYSEDLANIQNLYETALKTKVDENLVALRNLVAECEVIVNNQYYSSKRINYTRDSYASFTNMLNEARKEVDKGETAIDPVLAQTLINGLTQAKNDLVVADENTEGQEYGINADWSNGWDGEVANYNKSVKIRGGSLYISGYTANADGTVTVTVKWENSGIDPVTGGMFYNVPKSAAYNKYDAEYSYRPFTEQDLKKTVKLTSTIQLADGNYDSSYIEVDPLVDNEVLNGFEKDFVVPAGSKIDLKLTQTGNTSDASYTSSLGTYYVPNIEPKDTTAPEVRVEYSTVDKTEGPVTVTISADEPIQDISGWTRVSENVLKKDYTTNTNESIDILDLAGNVKTVSVTVSNIVKPTDPSEPTNPTEPTNPSEIEEDKNKGTETKKEDSKKTDGTNTGVFAGTGLFIGSATVAAAGAGMLAFLKKRKK